MAQPPPAQPSAAQLSPEQVRRLSDAPVGRLSTATASGVPHVIPVCFALRQDENGPVIYIVLDRKPKRAALTRLRRVRNILENPRVALVVDHYDDDWTQLWYILITGAAQLLEGEAPPESGSNELPDPSAHLKRLSPAANTPVEENPSANTAHSEPDEGSAIAETAHPEPVEGTPASEEIAHALRLLRDKYPQYRNMDIDGNPVIKITPRRVVSWSYSPESSL